MIPFPMAAMASSLTPKWMFLPAEFSAEKSPSPFISVLLEGPRSADPPIMPGISSFRRLIIFPDKDLVASGFSCSSHNFSLFIRESASTPLWYFSQSASISGYSWQ